MKDSFKSSSVIGLNWIYESDSLPESTSWKMPLLDKWKWAFERSRDSVSAGISETFFFFSLSISPLNHFPSRFKSSFRVAVSGRSKVFDALSDCKDKAAHLTHSAAASREGKKQVLNTFFLKAFHSRWHWPFQYLGTTTLPVCKVPIDGWCETAISQPIPQPQITVPLRSNHNVEKGLIALHPTYKVWLKWVFRRSAVGCWCVIIVH